MDVKWLRVLLHENLVSDGNRSVRVTLPSTCKLAGWVFFHPVSLVDFEDWFVRLRFHDGWVFRLSRGKARMELSAAGLLEALEGYSGPADDDSCYLTSFFEEHHPAKLEPVAREVIPDDLVNR